MDKTTLVIGIGSLILLGGIVFAATLSDRNAAIKGATSAPRDQCIEHATVAMHIHADLAIYVDGQKVPIPANTGISPECMKALHTHDDTGTIHIESPTLTEFTLGDFFAVWGQPLSASQILDKVVDDTHALLMTANGASSNEFEKLILADGQQIELRYTQK